MRTIKKRWGEEQIRFSGPYLVKRLVLEAGCQTSMHFHYAKVETIIVASGILTIDMNDKDHTIELDGEVRNGLESYSIGPGQCFTIREGKINAHRMRSERGCIYYEASTPQECDSERIYQ